jgi:hypothetical protein
MAWQKEIARLTEPFAIAYANALVSNFDATQLAYDLALSEDAAADLSTRVEGVSEDVLSRAAVAQIIADEMARRGLVEDSAVEMVIVALGNTSTEEAAPESEKARLQLLESVHMALQEIALHAPGGLSETDAILAEAAGDEASVQSVEGARRVVDALEQISLRVLLPFESTEKLWEAVRLTQGREVLRREIASAIEKHSGETAQKIAHLVDEYSTERTSWLKGQSETCAASWALTKRWLTGCRVARTRRSCVARCKTK